MSKLVLIVEDEGLVALTIEDTLLEAGYRVCGIATGVDDALELALRHRPDLAVVDVRLALGGDGIALAHALAAIEPIGILFATGNASDVHRRARAGQGCLSKPFEGEWLLAALEAVQGKAVGAIPGYFALPFLPTC